MGLDPLRERDHPDLMGNMMRGGRGTIGKMTMVGREKLVPFPLFPDISIMERGLMCLLCLLPPYL